MTFPVKAPSNVPATNVSEPTVHLSCVSFHIKLLFIEVPRSTSIPANKVGVPVSSALRVIKLSPIFTALESMVVVVP